MYFIGIDNGVTGTIGVIRANGSEYTSIRTPVKRELSYTKTVNYISRIDVDKLLAFLRKYAANCKCAMERPLINPAMFKATVSASRAFEATLIVLESLKIPYEFIDSKEWQKVMLPSGIHGKDLKKASLDVGRRLFPSVKHTKDADGILIAEYIRRRDNKEK